MPPLDFVGDYFWFAVLMCVLLLVGTGYAIAQNSISAISNDINAVIGNKGKSFDRARFFQSFQQLNLEGGTKASLIWTPKIEKILQGVSGGSASIINGLIQVTGNTLNLYLTNAVRGIFGPRGCWTFLHPYYCYKHRVWEWLV